MKEHYTIKEASKLLGLEEHTIRIYVSRGEIASKKIYNSRVIERGELIKQMLRRGSKITVSEMENL